MSVKVTGSKRVAIVGGGVIGGGWAARFLLHGWQVSVFDPHPETQARVKDVLENARRALPAVFNTSLPKEGVLTFVDNLEDAVKGAEWVQESVPERLDVKHQVMRQIQKAAPNAVVGSSTSGFKPSQLQEQALYPENILVAHPFNPVYLLPLVELVPTAKNTSDAISRAQSLLSTIGMRPLLVRKEIDAHIADRFLEAVWREALWLVQDDVATTEEIDEAIRLGFGLRWAQMGLFETYRLAGGEEGMAHFIRQFGPALKWPWTKLMDVPELTDELVQKIADQSDAQSGQYSIRELERIRDRNLVAFLRALKQNNWGAGKTLKEHEASLLEHQSMSPNEVMDTRMREFEVLPGWIDYNGHMTDFRYAQVFSETCDHLLGSLGVDDDYVNEGFGYYTTECQIRYLDEAKLGQRLFTTCQLISGNAKHIHAYFELCRADTGDVIATSEQLFLHVAREQGGVCAVRDDIKANVMRLVNAHADLPRPLAVGRYVGQRD